MFPRTETELHNTTKSAVCVSIMRAVRKNAVFENEAGGCVATGLDRPVMRSRSYAFFKYRLVCPKDISTAFLCN